MDPEAPCLLVASPSLLDPNFLHSVVLVMEHNEEGAMGFILNRPLPISLGQVCEESQMEYQGPETATAWRGGPVEPHRGMVLMRGGLPQDEDLVLDFTHFVSHRKDLLLSVVADPNARYRLFLGYAGWGPGQLDAEIEAGDWIRRPLVSEWLLHPEPAGLWAMAVNV